MHRDFPSHACGQSARASFKAIFSTALTVGLCLASAPAHAQIDTGINASVWKMMYGVSDAQLNSPAWLAADADGDGISNGAELAAGTNPFNRASTYALTSMTRNGNGSLALSFPTVAGKSYVVQGSNNLANPTGWTTLTPNLQVTGDGNTQTLTAPAATSQTFYRVVVQDLDTDSDGVSDWAEKITGFDPANSHTHGAAQDDHTALAADLAKENVITVTATKPGATQPANLATAATDTGTITITRGGTLHFSTLTVPLVWGGTAQAGVDYAMMPGSVTFAPKVGSITLTLTPLANATRRTAAAATVAVVPGGTYTTGGSGAASVLISPSASTGGTGLTGYYYASTWDAVGTYSANLFNPANLMVTRLDPTINFDWSTTPPDPAINHDNYVVRWTGQVQPQYSETYYFDTFTDDGVKLWVNGQLLIDAWTYQYWDRLASITLKAGVLYDIRMEFYQGGGDSHAYLYWSSPSQPKQIIPANRLYPSSVAPAPPAITSPSQAVGFVNQTFAFQLTASASGGAAATYALGSNSGPLPPGLTLNATTGLISGTPTTAGSYQIALVASSAYGTSAGVLTIQILAPGNGVTRELWQTGVTGPLVANIPLTATPTSTDTMLTTLEDTTVYPGNNTGERLRGYFYAPATGNYYFWLAANNNAELWISNDAEPVNKVRRAFVTAPGTTKEQWNAAGQPGQKSPWLSLVAGQKYYYEVLHNCGTASTADYVSVAAYPDPTGTTANPVANGTGLVPGYLLVKYDYPAAVSAAGTLYATNLSPQDATVASTGVGSANLRVSPDNTQAVLHFSFNGLSSSRTAYHIHVAPDQTGSGPIIFDLDDIDKFHPELKTADGGYIWNIAPVGAYSAAQIVAAIQAGTTYFNVHTVNYPTGEIRGFLGLVQGAQTAPTLVPDPGFTDDSATDAGAARFLHQAAYGAAPSDLATVESNGYAAWINAQFALPASHLLPVLLAHTNPDPNFNLNADLTLDAWWRQSITAPDQLRQRTAFALSQITVVSAAAGLSGDCLASYYDTLLDGAFGNFRDLLKAVTLHPAMGLYLNMLGNDRGNIATGLHPNENYAREIMQLFSVGLNRLWPDGTLVLDSQGNLVPTYSQSTIEGFARVFTGWNWNQPIGSDGRLPTNWYPNWDVRDTMTLVPTHHELGTKALLDNVVLPAAVGYNPIGDPVAGSQADPGVAAFDTYCSQDLEKALDSIFYHPNTGPFVCRQLIQRLVKSAPSPAYLQRVVARFNDDGTTAHVRGNLQAVLKAILLDGEARDRTAALSLATAGKQREPLLRLANVVRTFPVANNSGTYSQTAGGGAVLTITTQNPHHLSPYDNIALDFTVNATGTPPVEPPANPQSRDSYQVLDTPAPTANTFCVSAPDFQWLEYTEPAGSRTITMNFTGPSAGSSVYLHFYNALTPEGLYTVTGNPDANHFTVQSRASKTPTQAIDDWTQMNMLYAFATVANSSGTPATTTLTFDTYDNHNLTVGQKVYAYVPNGQSAQVSSGLFTVAGLTDPVRFTVQTGILPNNEGFYGVLLFPQQPPPLNRSGNVALPTSHYDMGYTDNSLAQSPLNSPTVFNFFYPDYKYPGNLAAANITTPEFQLTTDTNVINLTNQIGYTIFSSGNHNGLSTFNYGSLYMDLGPFMRAPYVSGTTVNVPLLVGKLGDLLTGGTLSDGTKNAIISYVGNATNFPPAADDSVRDRVRAAAHFILVSPDYAVQR